MAGWSDRGNSDGGVSVEGAEIGRSGRTEKQVDPGLGGNQRPDADKAGEIQCEAVGVQLGSGRSGFKFPHCHDAPWEIVA